MYIHSVHLLDLPPTGSGVQKKMVIWAKIAELKKRHESSACLENLWVFGRCLVSCRYCLVWPHTVGVPYTTVGVVCTFVYLNTCPPFSGL